MKKILVIILLVIGALILITQVLSRLSLPSTKPVSLTYWGLWEPENVMAQILADYKKKNPKVTIKYSKQSPRDYRERLQNALARGDGPDIFRLHNTWLPMFRNDLSPLPQAVIDAKTYESTFYPVAQKDFKAGGQYWAIPLEIDTLALFYNTDLFRTAGVDAPPEVWDDFPKTAAALTSKTPDGRITVAGTALGTASNVDHWQDILALMLLQSGTDLKNPTDSQAEEAMTYFTRFAKGENKTWDETLPGSTDAFIQGKLAMYFAPSWRVFDIQAANPDLKFKIAIVPQLSEDKVNYASYWAEAVSKKSKFQKEAWDFLKFLSSKEVLEKLFSEEAKTRLFGEPYARVDLAGSLKDDSLVAPFVEMAKTAQSWYLASFTNDGETGINSRIGKYFEDAINGIVKGQKNPKEALLIAAKGVNQTLANYGLAAPQGK